MKKKNNLYVADFETTTCEPAKVWLWGIVAVNYENPLSIITGGNNYVYGTDISGLIEFCKSLNNPIVYIHNLRFENSFLIDWLFNNGFEWIDIDEVPKDCKNKFTTIISGNHTHYQTEIIFEKNQKSKRTKKITFINSENIIPTSVLQIAIDLGNQEYIDIKKTSIDYNRHNQECEVTQQELRYNKNDCVIVAEMLQIMLSMGITLDRKHITIGSISLNTFKKIMREKKKSDVIYDKFFTDQYSKEVEHDIRKAYRGGYNYMNCPRGTEKKNVVIIDKNSMYSYIMKEKELPYGEPEKFKGERKIRKGYVYIQKITLYGKAKKNKLDFVQQKEKDKRNYLIYENSEFYEPYESLFTEWITSIEIEHIKKTYDIIDIEYHEGYEFKTSTRLFDEFISYFYNIKEQCRNNNKTMFYISKLILENLYGKFGTNFEQVSKRPYMANGKVYYKIIKFENNGKKYDFREKSIIYTPVSVFVTAYARIELINSIEKIIDNIGMENFLYADTDSIHFVIPESGEIPEFIELSNKLGAWKIENIAQNARYLELKRYILADDNKKKIKVVCAGLQNDVRNSDNVTWDNFHVGTTYKNIRKTKIVKGGKIIENTGEYQL